MIEKRHRTISVERDGSEKKNNNTTYSIDRLQVEKTKNKKKNGEKGEMSNATMWD